MILSSPHQNMSLPIHSANCLGERTMKLMVAAIDAYRFGYLTSCQQVSSMNESPTWKITNPRGRSGSLCRRSSLLPRPCPTSGWPRWVGGRGGLLMDPDQVDPKLLRFLVDREGHLRVVHAPGEGLAVVVADV